MTFDIVCAISSEPTFDEEVVVERRGIPTRPYPIERSYAERGASRFHDRSVRAAYDAARAFDTCGCSRARSRQRWWTSAASVARTWPRHGCASVAGLRANLDPRIDDSTPMAGRQRDHRIEIELDGLGDFDREPGHAQQYVAQRVHVRRRMTAVAA